jgi:hypothetical protein
VTADANLELAATRRVAGQPDDTQLIRTAVVGEVLAMLGLGDGEAGAMIDLAAPGH